MADLMIPGEVDAEEEAFDNAERERRAQGIEARKTRVAHSKVTDFIINNVGRTEEKPRAILGWPERAEDILEVAEAFERIAQNGLGYTFERIRVGKSVSPDQFAQIHQEVSIAAAVILAAQNQAQPE